MIAASYAPEEQAMRHCLRVLISACDGAKTLDGVGFDKNDASRRPFYESLLRQDRAWTARQLFYIIQTIEKYRKQLERAGITVPSTQTMQQLKQGREVFVQHESLPQELSRPLIDLRDGYLFVGWPSHDPKFSVYRGWIDEIKAEVIRLKEKNTAIHGFVDYQPQVRQWRIPLSRETFALLTANKYFNLSHTALSPAAQAYQRQLEEEQLAQRKLQQAEEAVQRAEYEKRLAALGHLHGEIAPGITLYAHQKVGIKWALWKDRVIFADETGLGKTLEGLLCAKAMHKVYGYRIYVITTLSSVTDWVRWAEILRVPIEVYSTDSIPVCSNLFPSENFVLIADESHKFQNMTAKRTQKFLALALHEQCKALYCLTGTPMPNGRPVGAYPLLLACQHSLVWDTREHRRKALKRQYEETFCGGRYKAVTSGMLWDVTGATNKYLWNRLVVYKPGDPNPDHGACLVARLKDDCLDLPPKRRIMRQADISPTAIQQFKSDVIALWERFENNVRVKLDTFTQEYKDKYGINPTPDEVAEEERKIRRAEAVVSMGIFRHAGARAKIEEVVEQAAIIIGQGHKVVIFTSFVDVAKEVGTRLAQESGTQVGYILGETTLAERDRVKDTFQAKNSTMMAVVSTAAGGEAITLTTAPWMFILDRPWTPGMVQQWEDRIHRISQTSSVTVYWVQLPQAISEVDIKVDGIIQRKKSNNDMLLFGRETQGLEFIPVAELENNAESFIRDTVRRFRGKR